jgi:hypothetical protein
MFSVDIQKIKEAKKTRGNNVKVIGHVVDVNALRSDLKVPSKYRTHTREDINILNTEIIKNSEAIVFIKDDEMVYM